MAWIELHQSVHEHRKTLRAARTLKCSPYLLVGHLTRLWCWALDAAPEGGPLHADDVKAGAAWKGRADVFVAALVDARFLDQNNDSYMLHDWDDYAGKLQDQRELRRESNRESQRRRRAKLRDVSAVSQHDNADSQHPTVPNPTQPKEEDKSSEHGGLLNSPESRLRFVRKVSR